MGLPNVGADWNVPDLETVVVLVLPGIVLAGEPGFPACISTSLFVRLQRSWTLMFGVIYKKIADLVLR